MASPGIENSSVHLSWTPPEVNSQCVIDYIIDSTLANSTISVTELLSRTLVLSGGNTTACTYTARVAAVDTAGRVGNYSEIMFVLSGKLKIPFSATAIYICILKERI